MRADLRFIVEKYAEFNELCFEGVLPKVTLRVGMSRRTLGTLRYRKEVNGGKIKYSDFAITISSRFDLSQNVIEDTLIHEMIHLYLCVSNLEDNSAHGTRFRAMMNAINNRFGRHISVTHRSTETENESDISLRHHYICISHWRNGDICITVCARTRIFEIHRRLSQHPDIRTVEWYYSTNPHFNRFPSSRTPKFYRFLPDTLAALETAIRCICDGNYFRPLRWWQIQILVHNFLNKIGKSCLDLRKCIIFAFKYEIFAGIVIPQFWAESNLPFRTSYEKDIHFFYSADARHLYDGCKCRWS